MEKIKVLCIDDEQEQREALCHRLRTKNYSVTTAASGQSGLSIFKKRRFDVVLCDLNMPKMDGLEFLESARKINPDIPVIILSSHGTIPAAVKSLQKGAFDFILEPPNFEEIEATISKAIDTTHLHKQLRDSNKNLEILVKNVPDIIYSLSPKGVLLDISPAVKTVMGYSPKELIGKFVFTFIHPEDQKRIMEGFEEAVEQGEGNTRRIGFRMLTKKGEARHFAVRTQMIVEDGKVSRAVGIATDITEHKEMEDTLMESEQKYRELVENANDLIFSMTPEGDYTYMSPNVKDILGHSVSKMTGEHFMRHIHPDDQKMCVAHFDKLKETGAKQSDIEYRIRHKDKSWRYHRSSVSPLKDSDGNVLYYVGVAHDFTEIKNVLTDLEKTNRYLKEAQSQLVQSEKMASLGQLVAGIAHEINTPIGAVNSMHDTLFRTLNRIRKYIQDELPEHCKQIPKLEESFKLINDSNSVIKSGTERVINIVTRLKSFARLDEADLKTVDIHEGIEDTLVLIHHELKHGIIVVKNFGDVPPISCFPSELNQVFLNLLINGKQAIRDKGTINIATYVKNKKVHIMFSDDGVGIPKESMDRIFDPGYTTKGIGVGTGLGLSISYNIIKNHKGEIKVNSELGKGTEFMIVLPMDLETQLAREDTKI
jgi:PAS domain S-box-containing protein